MFVILGRYLISQHPEVEAGIMEELDSLELTITPERPNPRPMVYADLSKMVYLNAVIKVRLAAALLNSPEALAY